MTDVINQLAISQDYKMINNMSTTQTQLMLPNQSILNTVKLNVIIIYLCNFVTIIVKCQ